MKRWIFRSLGIKGTAAIELALLAPLLMTLGTGSWDFGNALREEQRLESAARAGAQFATASIANASDYEGTIHAARNDASDAKNALGVSAAQVCRCPGGSSVSCSGTCAGNASPRVYEQVIVSERYPTLVKYPFVGNPIALSGSAMLRLN
jgi:Flp pilus assembly protein TadG